jgi:peptidoglycan/xylan/chitin deacetylase (PgdA/CDA1 family)
VPTPNFVKIRQHNPGILADSKELTTVLRQTIIRSGLEGLYFTGAYRVLGGLLGGVGAILTLHHVRLASTHAFQPNRLLEVTPTFLEDVILELRRSGVEIVTLDEMHRRLVERDFQQRFVCLTFDDGYRDNREWAYPILKKHKVPFAIYVPTSFPDQLGELWWLVLERVIADNDRVAAVIAGEDRTFNCGTPEEKRAAYDFIYWRLRSLDSEGELRASINDLAARYSLDASRICRDLCMTWDELRELASDPLVTIGAHTVNHIMLRKASDAVARREMKGSADVIEAALGRRPAHFSYPIGDTTSAGPREFAIAKEFGFKTAVTTRPGVLFPEHERHLTALPRISLNGEFQRLRYFNVLVSGAATAVWNGFRRVDAA